MVDLQLLRFIGGLLLWCLKGFTGSFGDAKNYKYSAIIGLIFITILILLLVKIFG
jgi:hypothetical protein